MVVASYCAEKFRRTHYSSVGTKSGSLYVRNGETITNVLDDSILNSAVIIARFARNS